MKQRATKKISEGPKAGRRPSFAEMQARIDALEAELAEAREQQTATGEVVGVINSSPGDLAPVFDAMLDKATRLCDAAFGVLLTYDGEHFRHGALRSVPPAYAEFMRQNPPEYGSDSGPGRLLAGERVVHFLDMKDSDPYRAGEPNRRAIVDLAGARTLLMVPLHKDGSLLGTISVYRQHVRPFTEKQIALLQNFAAQAVIAMENARLLIETREALEQQTATAEVLQVINSSPGNLAPVFDAMLEKAVRLCDAGFGALHTFDGEAAHAVAVHNLPRSFAEYHWAELTRFYPAGLFGRAIHQRRTVHVADAAAEEPYRAGVPTAVAAVELGGVRTLLHVPLIKEDRVLGVFSVYRQEVRPFTDKQMALLQNFATQAVIAMENARLLTETREALAQQTATAEVLQVINSSPGDLAVVLNAMLEKATGLCGAAHGNLWTYDGERFHPAATHGSPRFAEWIRRRGPFLPEPGSTNERILQGESVIEIPDLARDPASKPDNPNRRALIEIGGFRTSLSVALRKEQSLLGVLHIFRQEVRRFSEKEIALVQNFAAQAVIAMENARLLTETREALEQQTATAEVLQVINSSPGHLTPVFDTILEKAHALCSVAYGGLALYDGEYFRGMASRGYPEQTLEAFRRRFRGNAYHRRLVRGERYVHIPDMQALASEELEAVGKAGIAAGIRSIIMVPLRKEGTLLGHISASRCEVRPFSEKEIALLQNFAAQAVIAMENARLLTETREALEQQTATAEVLGVINSSPGELTPVFDAILEKAHTLCDVTHGSLQLFDGEMFRAVAVHGLSEATAERLRQGYRPGPTSPNRRLLDGDQFTHILDLAEIDDPVARRVAELSGVRTTLCVALRKDDALLGQIVAARQEVRPFTDKQIALLENFAAQAVIAMENARLLGELRERTRDLEESLEYQTATSDVLQVISRSTFDLKPVLDTVIRTAAQLCQAEVGHIATPDGDVYRPLATFALSPTERDAFIRTRVFKADNTTVVGHAASERKVIHVADLQTEPAYASFPVVVTATQVRTILAVPLLRLGEPIGVLSLGRWRVEPFTDRQIELVRTFADQAVIAMENARLLGELRQRTDEVVELNRGLEARVAEQVEELGRVGRLKRFLAPQLAELIVSHGDEKILESHRRDIVVVFCDLRGYTAFTETAEPEEVLDFLREYHGALGPLVSQFEGTLDQFSGDGIMVFFNDPVPCPDPAERAVKMAMAMRAAAGTLTTAWRRRRGRVLGFGAGIAQGYATLGQIGFAERSGYTAIGTVCNLAARLCAEAQDGQILIGQQVAVAVEETITLEEVGALTLKGLTQPVVAYNVPLAPIQPALRVIEGGPQSV